MTSWKRIILVVFVLIGGTMTFSYWSFSQFNNTLGDFETTLTANILSNSSFIKKEVEPTFVLPETSDELVTPTADETTPIIAPTPTPIPTPTKTPTTPVTTAPVDLKLSLDFPPKDDEIYIGCIYPISWQSSTTINLLETALIDGGTKETKGPIASGLAKENTIEKDSQYLKWKVGVVWPGDYYIKVSKVNGIDKVARSKYFTINNIPRGLSVEEREKICEESGGLLATSYLP